MSPAGEGAAVELAAVSKRYWQVQDRAMLLRSILPFARPERRELWALRDVDVRVERGETVGVLGRNGAGKSTLLRLLAGVSRPTEGEVTIRGRVAPLLSVGVGFHPEMSGRENVYVNGMLLGLTRAEVAERFADIVAFAELEEAVDTPVKFYSSGMFMRLGFAVAVHVDPQVLLVDEVLAVGDIAFQLKCFERMRSLQAAGATVVLVSHSMHAIRLLCSRALLFRHGELVQDGPTEGVIAAHHQLLSSEGEAHDRIGSVRVEGAELCDAAGRPAHHAAPGERLEVRLALAFDEEVDSPHLLFDVFSEDGTLAYEMKTTFGRAHRRYRPGERADVVVAFTPRLGGGTYRLQWTVTDRDGRAAFVREPRGLLLYVAPPLGSAGIADLDAAITVDGTELTDHSSMLLGGAADHPPASPDALDPGRLGRVGGAPDG